MWVAIHGDNCARSKAEFGQAQVDMHSDPRLLGFTERELATALNAGEIVEVRYGNDET